MESDGAQGRTLILRENAAANDESTGIVDRPDPARAEQADGWDPYEVWRTRVKPSLRTRPDRADNPEAVSSRARRDALQSGPPESLLPRQYPA
jgi:hypothetical protein